MIILTDILSDRIPVESLNLRSVSYDLLDSILEIEFHGGRIYQYFDVPAEIFDGLMDAGSHGKFFAIFIRSGFLFQRIQ